MRNHKHARNHPKHHNHSAPASTSSAAAAVSQKAADDAERKKLKARSLHIQKIEALSSTLNHIKDRTSFQANSFVHGTSVGLLMAMLDRAPINQILPHLVRLFYPRFPDRLQDSANILAMLYLSHSIPSAYKKVKRNYAIHHPPSHENASLEDLAAKESTLSKTLQDLTHGAPSKEYLETQLHEEWQRGLLGGVITAAAIYWLFPNLAVAWGEDAIYFVMLRIVMGIFSTFLLETSDKLDYMREIAKAEILTKELTQNLTVAFAGHPEITFTIGGDGIFDERFITLSLPKNLQFADFIIKAFPFATLLKNVLRDAGFHIIDFNSSTILIRAKTLDAHQAAQLYEKFRDALETYTHYKNHKAALIDQLEKLNAALKFSDSTWFLRDATPHSVAFLLPIPTEKLLALPKTLLDKLDIRVIKNEFGWFLLVNKMTPWDKDFFDRTLAEFTTASAASTPSTTSPPVEKIEPASSSYEEKLARHHANEAARAAALAEIPAQTSSAASSASATEDPWLTQMQQKYPGLNIVKLYTPFGKHQYIAFDASLEEQAENLIALKKLKEMTEQGRVIGYSRGHEGIIYLRGQSQVLVNQQSYSAIFKIKILGEGGDVRAFGRLLDESPDKTHKLYIVDTLNENAHCRQAAYLARRSDAPVFNH